MTLTLTLPPVIVTARFADRARIHLALGAFIAEEVTLARAAEIAGIPLVAMMSELSRRKIPLHYDREDFAADLKTISELNAGRSYDRHQ